MRKYNIAIIIGSIIIGVCIIISTFIFIKMADKSEAEKTQEMASYDGGFMTIEEAADFLKLSEDEILYIISSEEKTIKELGEFGGSPFPYIKINNKYYFNKSALGSWLLEASDINRTYEQEYVTK